MTEHPQHNVNTRLETFCDGVFAIALTLLVIDIKVPPSHGMHTTHDLWLALRHLLPAVFAFVLSFATILVTWSNHHANFKLVDKSSAAFVLANGFLLLTVVLMPFPTALLGEYIATDHASPAVVLYTAIDGLQAIGWILMTRAAVGAKPLTRDAQATQAMRESLRHGYFALVLYSVCAVLAFWFPLIIAAVVTATWILWLSLSVKARSTT